ncbi:serine hydrolase domain-containing protein [Lentisalinibacter orientalis]|uniref:serine hydrolase domain-containing protein n=1 Tax=Lentisalinibacter orientalis TaxID=2992241 RepID=UPI00386A277E
MRRLYAAALGLAAAIALSPPAAADPTAAFQDALEALHAEHGFPGATAACILPDGSVSVAATGLADVDAGRPMRPDDRMLAASIGKTFTGAMALAIAREGRLGLDDRLAEWLGKEPWYERLPNHDTITLRHLLRHRSGLPDHVYDEAFGAEFAQRLATGRSFTPRELIGYVFDDEPLFPAGEGFAYTDTGYVLLGLVIEKATGERYYEGVARRFLEPIGLAQTTPSDRRDLDGLVSGYLGADNPFGLPAKTLTEDGLLVFHPALEWTAGGFVSTSGDLARWGAALFGGEAMPGDYLPLLLASAPIDPARPAARYGLGVAEFRGGHFGDVYGHAGWIPGYTSSLRHYADHGVTIAFQVNTDIGFTEPGSELMGEIEARLAEAVIGP